MYNHNLVKDCNPFCMPLLIVVRPMYSTKKTKVFYQLHLHDMAFPPSIK